MKDVITRQTVVDKLAAYLHHELSLLSRGRKPLSWMVNLTATISETFETAWLGWGSPTYERLAWPFDKLRTGLGRLRTPAPAIRLFSPYPDRNRLITCGAASRIMTWDMSDTDKFHVVILSLSWAKRRN